MISTRLTPLCLLLFIPLFLLGPRASLSLVVDLSDESGADVTAMVAAGDTLYVLEHTSGEVRAFPLHGMARAEQFSKVLRRREGDEGLIVGQPVALAMGGSELYVLDDRATLFVYDARDSARTRLGLRVESRQGTLGAMALPRGPGELDVLETAPGGQQRLWAYRRTALGYTASPRLLGWPAGLPAGPAALRGGLGAGGLLITVNGRPFVAWPGGTRRAVGFGPRGGAPPTATGTLWVGPGTAPSTVLVLDGRQARVEAYRLEPNGGSRPLPPLTFRAPAGATTWQAIAGDKSSGYVYLSDAHSRIYALPLPMSWR